MERNQYLQEMAYATEKMANGGIFLTVGGDHSNTMTIGWGSIGFMWGRPVFTALVRPSRHSWDLLRDKDCFTVSVPVQDDLKAELLFAGSTSGRDVDKFSGHGLTAQDARTVEGVVVKECGLHFECVIQYRQDMSPEQMEDEIVEYGYKTGDFHTMIVGEIVDVYRD